MDRRSDGSGTEPARILRCNYSDCVSGQSHVSGEVVEVSVLNELLTEGTFRQDVVDDNKIVMKAERVRSRRKGSQLSKESIR